MVKKKIIHDGVEIEVDESHPLFPVPVDSDTKAKWAEDGARAMRNGLLASTDWTQLDDVPQTTKDKYKSYRQELRDLPQHPDFPNVTMPSEPE